MSIKNVTMRGLKHRFYTGIPARGFGGKSLFGSCTDRREAT